MADKYPSTSPYTYCANNPVVLKDPDGREVGEYFDMEGNWLGTDGKNDFRVYFVEDPKSQAQLKNDAAEKKFTTSSIKSKISTSIFVLNEIIDVYDRTAGGDNMGQYEEGSAFENDFFPCMRSDQGIINHVELKIHSGSTSIHSHTFVEFYNDKGEPCLYTPEYPSGADNIFFKNFTLNVIVGKIDGNGSGRLPKAYFYNSSTDYIMNLEIGVIRKILRQYGDPVRNTLRHFDTYRQ